MKKGSPSYICSTCRKRFYFEDIRYSKDGKKIMCRDCYNEAMKEQEKEGKMSPEGISNRVKLRCIGCGYKFSLKKRTTSKIMCPYCSGDRLVKDDITADKIIAEVSQSSRYD